MWQNSLNLPGNTSRGSDVTPCPDQPNRERNKLLQTVFALRLLRCKSSFLYYKCASYHLNPNQPWIILTGRYKFTSLNRNGGRGIKLHRRDCSCTSSASSVGLHFHWPSAPYLASWLTLACNWFNLAWTSPKPLFLSFHLTILQLLQGKLFFPS